MGNGWPRDGAIGLLSWLASLVIALVWLWGGAASLAAQSALADLNARAVAAYSANDLKKAESLTRQAIALGPDQGEASDYLEALNNLIFLREQGVGDALDKATLIDQALGFANASGQGESAAWLQAAGAQMRLFAASGESADLELVRAETLRRFRGTQLHAVSAGIISDASFAAGHYGPMRDALREMLGLGRGYLAQTSYAQITERQGSLQDAGQIDAALILIEIRLILIRAGVMSQDARINAQLANSALWEAFFLFYQTERFADARRALADWLANDALSPQERDFLTGFAKDTLVLAQLVGFGDRSAVQLEFADLVTALIDATTSPDDPLRAAALRERGAAENALDLLDRAEISLQASLRISARTSVGTSEAYLVLEDLASLAWKRGQLDLSGRLFEQASEGYEQALKAGAAPLGDFDLAILESNRAKRAVSAEQMDEAGFYLARAKDAFAAAKRNGALKSGNLRFAQDLLETEVALDRMAGDLDSAIAKTLQIATDARASYAPDHPALALALSNAADQLFVLDQPEKAQVLLQEATGIARASLPDDAPLLAEIAMKQALGELTSGSRPAALTHLREATQMRKSPRYRGALADASAGFDILAWAVLDNDSAPNPAQIDEALTAVQWTQISGSAEAVSMMSARLSETSHRSAALLKTRQDIMIEARNMRTALTETYSGGVESRARRDALIDKLAALDTELAKVEAEMENSGLDLPELTGPRILTLAEIQDLLAPDELLITFALPGLIPERISGLTGSSNFAIAVSAKDYKVARIPEISRGALGRKITAFRCEMAISDGVCASGGAKELRGAMLAAAPAPREPAFDWRIAYDLYRDLFGGLQGDMNNAKHIIIAPPGDLLRLPFHALITARQPEFSLQNADWFIRSHAISVLPSLSALKVLRHETTRPQNKVRRMLGFGDPAVGQGPDASCDRLEMAALRAAGPMDRSLYSPGAQAVPLADPDRLRGLARLPDAACELAAIAASFPAGQAELKLQEHASESVLKGKQADGTLAGYDVLVFATHGLTSGETAAIAPGLVLSPPKLASGFDDGLLTAAEVAALTLNAELVVLSACNTAAGETPQEEGLSGLARGFFHAGAKALLVTHWSVYSDAAVRVTTGMFDALAQDRDLGKSAALRRAVLGILDDPAASPLMKHPGYWAAFAVIGR